MITVALVLCTVCMYICIKNYNMQYIVQALPSLYALQHLKLVIIIMASYFIFNSWTPSTTTKLTNVFEFSKHHAYHGHIEISMLHQPCCLAACTAVATFHGCNL